MKILLATGPSLRNEGLPDLNHQVPAEVTDTDAAVLLAFPGVVDITPILPTPIPDPPRLATRPAVLDSKE